MDEFVSPCAEDRSSEDAFCLDHETCQNLMSSPSTVQYRDKPSNHAVGFVKTDIV